MSELTISSLMDRLPEAFLPDKAKGVDAVIQFSLTGDQGGDWYITIKEGTCKVAKGKTASPKLTISADAKDMLDIFTGKLNAMAAFSGGKLKLAGDLGLSMKLMNFFKIGG